MTSYEAVALNSVALATAGASLWQRLTSRVPRDVTRRRTWDADAELMRSLGLEPAAVLGPPPEVRAATAAPIATPPAAPTAAPAPPAVGLEPERERDRVLV